MVHRMLNVSFKYVVQRVLSSCSLLTVDLLRQMDGHSLLVCLKGRHNKHYTSEELRNLYWMLTRSSNMTASKIIKVITVWSGLLSDHSCMLTLPDSRTDYSVWGYACG